MAINKRTVYYSKDRQGRIQFLNIAKVETELGSMLEPFDVNAANSAVGFDYTDEMSRIDEMKEIDHGKRKFIVSDGIDISLHAFDRITG